MGLGDDIKTAVDEVREMLGTTCLLNGSTDIGLCAVYELSTSSAKEALGADFEDEFSMSWALIEAPAGAGVKQGNKITVSLTGQSWLVRRVTRTQAAGVAISERCLCCRELV